MKAFAFDHNLIDAYERFSRSFSTIRAADIKSEIDRQYDSGRFWPDALLSLNPRFLSGPTVDDLVASGDLDEATGKIFRILKPQASRLADLGKTYRVWGLYSRLWQETRP